MSWSIIIGFCCIIYYLLIIIILLLFIYFASLNTFFSLDQSIENFTQTTTSIGSTEIDELKSL